MDRLRVLVALDESASAYRALQFAVKRAARAHDEVVVLSVLDSRLVLLTARTNPRGSGTDETYGERIAGLLNRATLWAASQGVPVEGEIRPSADPAIAIVKYAREGHFDEIVLGHRERRGLEKVVIGSTALRVLELTPVPVTLVR
jgi:nucleotide-binding universal stress UspA family protein